MAVTTILVSTFPPFSSLAFDTDSHTTLETLPSLISSLCPTLPPLSFLTLSGAHGPISLSPSKTVAMLGHGVVSLRLAPSLAGGKGGFGSQLRAAGGRMSSQKTSNNDSCRDLSGRRLSTIKEAQRLSEYLESEPARKKAEQEAQKARLEALERKLGIDTSSGSTEPAQVAGKKHRFEDTEYLEQSRDIVDGVKSAVAAGLLKKRKKAKLVQNAAPQVSDVSQVDAAPTAATSAGTPPAVDAAPSAVAAAS